MSKKRQTSGKDAHLIRQRNLVRGMVGAARGWTYELGKNDKALRLRNDMRAAMLAARAKLSVEDYDKYLAWMAEETERQAGELKRLPIGFDFLNGVFSAPSVPFDQELAWVTARLAQAAHEINSFRILAEALDAAFWAADYDAIDKLVAQIGNVFGQSFWLLELRIALEQNRSGLEAQKKLTEEFKSKHRRGLVSYVAHYTSVRNEPSVTPWRFAERIAGRIGATRYNEPIKVYLKYRLAWEWPAARAGLAQILQVEQSHSDIDLYETFLAMAQHAVTNGHDPTLAQAFRDALGKLDAIKDYRLDKLCLLLGDGAAARRLPARPIPGADLLFEGKLGPALRMCLLSLRDSPADVHQLLTAAAALSASERRQGPRDGPPRTYVLSRLAALFAKRDDMDGAVLDLIKMARNFAGLPTARAVIGACSYLSLPGPPDDMGALRLVSMNSLHLDPSDVHVVLAAALPETRAALEAAYPASAALAFHLSASGATLGSATASGGRMASLAHSLGLARTGNFPAATSEARSLAVGATAGSIATTARLLEMHCLLRVGSRGSVIDMIAKETVSGAINSKLLPVEATLGGARWRDIKVHGDRLALPIAVDLLWRQTNDDAVATLRRFAFDEFLTRHGLSRPSQLEATASQFNAAELIYYLRHLCVPTVMDMSSAFEGSRDLDIERRAVCALLSILDKGNAAEYRDEILEITHRILIEDGLRVVDSSRVHVDTDAIRQWAEKEFKESFARYQDLVAAGIGVADDLEKVLRSILRQDKATKYLDVPESEADELLVRMIHDLRDRFLSDEAHGLDSYLSRRVRHNSMSGYLRGPVEEAHLITQRDKEAGTYKPNIFWLDRLLDLGPAERSEAERHFRRFAEDFDSIIDGLKNDAFHILSPKRPRGLFEIPLSASAYHLVRSAIQSDPSVGTLIDGCLRLFWASLEPSLRRARDMLRVEAKAKASEAFQRLRAGLASLPGQDRGFAELSMAIGDASAQVHREIDRVADWFNKTESNSATTQYTLDQVIDIAVESALATHRALCPRVVRTTMPDFGLGVGTLLIVADVIFIALDNVLTHSGIEPAPEIVISSEIRPDGDALSFKVSNDIAPGVRCAATETELACIRRDIESQAYKERVKEEGRSGLYKLASIVGQSGKGRLDFGFLGDDKFFVEVDLELVDVGPADEEAADVCVAS